MKINKFFIVFIAYGTLLFAANKHNEINFCKNNFIEKFQIQNIQEFGEIQKNADFYANLLKERPYNEEIYNNLIKQIKEKFQNIINSERKLKNKKKLVHKQILAKYQNIILFSSFFIENQNSINNLKQFLKIMNFYDKDYFMKKVKISYFVKYEIMKKTGHFIYAKDPEIFLKDYLNKIVFVSKKDIAFFYWLYHTDDKVIKDIYDIEKNQQTIKKYFESIFKIFDKICFNEKKYIKEMNKKKKKKKKNTYFKIFENYMTFIFSKENGFKNFNNIRYLTLEKNPDYQFFWYYLEYKFNKMTKNYKKALIYFLLLTKFENNPIFLIQQSFNLYNKLIANEIISQDYYKAWTHSKWIIETFYKNKNKLKQKLLKEEYRNIEKEIIREKQIFLDMSKELKKHFLKTKNIKAISYINLETEKIINFK